MSFATNLKKLTPTKASWSISMNRSKIPYYMGLLTLLCIYCFLLEVQWFCPKDSGHSSKISLFNIKFALGSFIEQAISYFSSQESFSNHNYFNVMNNIKFEHRSGALPFISFLSVCAPVLCSKIIQTKKEIYDR